MKRLLIIGFVISLGMHSVQCAQRGQQPGTRVSSLAVAVMGASLAHSAYAAVQGFRGPQAPSEELRLLRKIDAQTCATQQTVSEINRARLERAQTRAAVLVAQAVAVAPSEREIEDRLRAKHEAEVQEAIAYGKAIARAEAVKQSLAASTARLRANAKRVESERAATRDMRDASVDQDASPEEPAEVRRSCCRCWPFN